MLTQAHTPGSRSIWTIGKLRLRRDWMVIRVVYVLVMISFMAYLLLRVLD